MRSTGGRPGASGEGVRPVRDDVPGQVSQGHGVPRQELRSVANVLQVSCGAGAPYPPDEPDRVDVLDGASEACQDEGEREPDGLPDDGLQADGECIQQLMVM